MGALGTVLLAVIAAIAAVWVIQGTRVLFGMRKVPRLRETPPLDDAECPTVSVLFSARDEEEKLPQALATLLALDYPRYEVVAVNDRSSDATGRILGEAAARDPRLKVVDVTELPAGWLGKPHGLQRAYEASGGEWLVFTDADVRFAPGLLRRSLALAKARGWDHMTLFGHVEMHGFWEHAIMTFFMLSLTLYTEAWRVADPRSKKFLGVGSFQLFRRAAYEAAGTHRRLAMEVVDDMKLGKLAKLAGFRSGLALAGRSVAVRWHAGLGNITRGVEKNFFAGADFSLAKVSAQFLAIVALEMLPVLLLAFVSGWSLVFATIALAIPAAMQGMAARESGASPLYGLTFPLGAAIFGYMLARSTVITLRQGGIVWRGTFYRLSELRKGIV
ncbi:MAG: glycosyltransferase [Candidatus Acidiferrales bacterium]